MNPMRPLKLLLYKASIFFLPVSCETSQRSDAGFTAEAAPQGGG